MCDWHESLVERFHVAGAQCAGSTSHSIPAAGHAGCGTQPCPEMLGMKLLSQTSPGAARSVLCCQNLVTPQFAKL